MNLQGILNWAIPLLIVLIFFALFYSKPKIKLAVHTLFGLIGKMFSGAKDKISERSEQTYQTVYRYG
jgi:hypothetical protein